ncbi:nucleotidyltransferase domain-containing protein [Planococcus lenghuensis]|uniref:Nucleotidyltransferase n=1 Tax=Planococcus lenghuensis TaxID=2213202 RepID=A0A1Q2KYU6_9BACL|nr:nucleotidyltransferase domain-containing protein [Planococcus lenghuensis]AQQ53306.1 nucleotidyltransferase [Planococcus lenghuensis]
MKPKLGPREAAGRFISKYFPDCTGAVLAGSVVRGEATETSDLDIIVFDPAVPDAYRESLVDFGWPIEVFVHNFSSYSAFFASDCTRARPSLPRMLTEGIVLRGSKELTAIKEQAQALLERGPDAWSEETIRSKRYFLTDALEDFIGCTDRTEELFIAGTLGELISEFELRTHRRWIGTSKWIVRALKEYDPDFAAAFTSAFEHYYRNEMKEDLIRLADQVLAPHGGRLFSGFSLGKS